MAERQDMPNNNGNPAGQPQDRQGKRKSDGSLVHGVDNIVTTECELIDFFTTVWTLKNFSVFKADTNEVPSPIFQGGPNTGHSWQMKLIPKQDFNGEKYHSLFIHLKKFGDRNLFTSWLNNLNNDQSDRNIKIRFRFTILDADGNPGHQMGGRFGKAIEMSLSTPAKDAGMGYGKFILASKLDSPANRLIVDDSVQFKISVWIEGKTIHTYVSGAKSPDKGLGLLGVAAAEEVKAKRKRDKFVGGLKKIFDEAIYTDMVVKTADKSFPTHRAILAGSSVFAAKLAEGVHIVNIQNFDNDVVHGMLEYMYTGEIDLTQRAPDLFMIADEYKLAELKEDCMDIMINNIDAENAVTILMLSLKCNEAALKSKTIDFIKRNENIIQTDNFMEVIRAFPNTISDFLQDADAKKQ